MTRTLAFIIALLASAAACLGQGDFKELSALLTRMSAAARAADKDAFLACLDLSDPFFKTEQSAWCDDLVKNGVKEVEFSAAGEPAADGGGLTAELTIRYTSNKGAATSGARASWPARFIRRSGNLLYAGENWQELKGEDFRVLFFAGDERTAQSCLEAFPRSRAHVNEGFGVAPGFQQIKLFRDMDHLKATVYLNQPDPVLMGWNEPGESIKFMRTYSRTVAGWTAAFGHEYGHVATWEYGPGIKKSPWWVHEGVAELAAEDLIPNKRQNLDRQIRDLARAGKLVQWDRMADYDKADQSVKRMAYTQGHHMLGYISEQWGREGRTRWLKAMGSGKPLDDACLEVMGMHFADLDREWRWTLPAPEPTGAEVEAVRAGLADTLASMKEACLRADAPAYLRCIYEGDSEFLYEQRYFAKDMAKKPPVSLSITLDDKVTFQDDMAQAHVTWNWRMAENKDQRDVSFEARFIRQERDGKPVWLYAGEVWQRKVAPGAVVMYDDGLEAQGEEALKGFASVRDHVETGFNLTDKDLPRRTQKIKLYSSMKHLQLSICLSYENGLGGWNEPHEPIKLLVRKGRPGGLRNVIAHEYGHVATFELGPASNSMPWWILEGVADLSAEKFSGKGGQFIERQARAGKLAPWDELADFETVKPQYQMYVYQQGHHMLGYISDRWGRDTRVAWLAAMANGKTLDEATRDVLGRPFAQLDQEWRASLPQPENDDPQAAQGQAEKSSGAAAPEPAGVK